jgi:hypothetical protein
VSSIRGTPACFVAIALFVTACQANAPTSGRDIPPKDVTSTLSTPKPHLVPRAAPAPTVTHSTKLLLPRPNTEDTLNRRLAELGLDNIDNAAGLVGQSAAKVMSLMGTPDLTRQEHPAELWQYTSKRCVLNLFLYNHESGQQKINHADLRSRDPSRPIAPDFCLKEIILGRIGETG